MRSSSLPEENHQEHIKRTEAFVCHYFPSTLTGVVKSVFVQSAQLSLRLCAFKVFFFFTFIYHIYNKLLSFGQCWLGNTLKMAGILEK